MSTKRKIGKKILENLKIKAYKKEGEIPPLLFVKCY